MLPDTLPVRVRSSHAHLVGVAPSPARSRPDDVPAPPAQVVRSRGLQRVLPPQAQQDALQVQLALALLPAHLRAAREHRERHHVQQSLGIRDQHLVERRHVNG